MDVKLETKPLDKARGERLRQARKDAGLTQEQVADSVPTTYVSISSWENGANISEDKLERLARIYKKSKAYLRYGEDLPADSADGFTPNPALRKRLRPKPYARVYEHIDRMVQANCSLEQIEEAERLMIDGAYNKLNKRDSRERSDAEMIMDIDAAWVFIKEVLEREGVKGL